MRKFRILDLFCGGGGASLGYEQAGLEVVGVDLNKQKNYRGEFIQSDAIEFLLENYKNFDFVHASPPCQKYSKSAMQWRKNGKEYPDLIEPTRAALISTGKPYIIENVTNAPLINPFLLCGAMFDIPTYRHRLFESNLTFIVPEHPKHIIKCTKLGRKTKHGEFIDYVGHFSGVLMVKQFTGLHWLNLTELAQSLPPQYTKFTGEQLVNLI